MRHNQILKELGLSNDARVVIIHADDIGMCQASLDAYVQLFEIGGISSAAVMVPCPWFPATAAYCRTHHSVDMGVHITITSEWETYRWGPISTRDASSGMIDNEGYFHRDNAHAQQAEAVAVATEINRQIEQALVAGIDVTHADTHMGTVAHPHFMQSYLHSALTRGIMPFVPRMSKEMLMAGFGMDEASAVATEKAINQFEKQGIPLIDHIRGYPLSEVLDDPLAKAKEDMAALEPGITHYVIHPSIDTPELHAITPDAAARITNYEVFMNNEIRDFIQAEGIHVIGYRELREVLRQT